MTMEIIRTIGAALLSLGYGGNQTYSVKPIDGARTRVWVNDAYIGIWDAGRETFVD